MDAMNTLWSTWRAREGDDRVTRGEATRDISAYPLGTPALVARPADLAMLARMVSDAHAHAVKMVPVGRRTAYWRPLELGGAVALDLAALDHVRFDGDVVVCGAGAMIRPLDEALRARGLALPIHPDAFGDTSVGAMIASACTSGVGMGQGSIDRHVAGLTVITGDGRVLRTGAGGAWAHLPPFMRDGVPDLTGAFLGAEGALGVVAEVVLHARRAPWRARLVFTAPVDAAHKLAALGRELAQHGVVDTFRAVRESEREAPRGWGVDLWISSPLSMDEARRRASWAAARVYDTLQVTPTVAVEDEAARAGHGPAYDARWNGPIDAHTQFAARAQLVGMDVNAPYDALPSLLAVADAIQAEQLTHGVLQSRTALYLSAEFVNLGMHAAASHDPAEVAWAHAHVARWLGRLSSERVVPYRLGRTWPQASVDAIRPEVRAAWQALKRHLDPKHLLNPTHPLFPERP